jgi:PPOX class probable F420-dependent enzyme
VSAPRRAFERFGRLSDRVFDRLRDKRAFTLTDDGAIEGDFRSLRAHKYAVVVTFRRNGDAVASPSWFAVAGKGAAYLKTRHDAGKVKRLRNDSRTLIAVSSARGKPKGSAIRATGRVLPKEEWGYAEETLARAYGIGRRVSERVLGGPEDLAAYIEIVPRR